MSQESSNVPERPVPEAAPVLEYRSGLATRPPSGGEVLSGLLFGALAVLIGLAGLALMGTAVVIGVSSTNGLASRRFPAVAVGCFALVCFWTVRVLVQIAREAFGAKAVEASEPGKPAPVE